LDKTYTENEDKQNAKEGTGIQTVGTKRLWMPKGMIQKPSTSGEFRDRQQIVQDHDGDFKCYHTPNCHRNMATLAPLNSHSFKSFTQSKHVSHHDLPNTNTLFSIFYFHEM
jgi:hypothetical protein